MDSVSLEFTRGDTVDIPIKLTDEHGVAVNITGWTVFFTAKISLTDTDDDAQISKTVTTHTKPTEGETNINLSPAETDYVGPLMFDIQVKTGSGDIYTIVAEGLITFKQDITQRVN